MAPSSASVRLPEIVVGIVDLSRLIRELRAIGDALDQEQLRSKRGIDSNAPPKMSRSLEEFVSLNHIDLSAKKEREDVCRFLEDLRSRAMVVHISFATDPSASFTSRIVAWFRAEVHPLVLIQVGLQPNIAAGCIVRTENKYFDFSLRHRFSDNRKLLVDMIEGQHE